MLRNGMFWGTAFAAALTGLTYARAGEIKVAGTSTGTVSGVSQLAFNSQEFFATTSNGVGSLTGSNSLGVFALSSDSAAKSGTFVLSVSLAEPAGIVGGQVLGQEIVGTISPKSDGGVVIHFTNPAVKAAFDTGGTQGSFSITVADVSVEPGQSAPLVAVLSGAEQTDACRLNFTAARATPTVLGAAGQQKAAVAITTVATDNPGCGLSCKIESVSSNDGEGSSGDWRITGDLTLSLRPGGASDGNGRIYAVAVQCSDNAGNRVVRKAPVVVPGVALGR